MSAKESTVASPDSPSVRRNKMFTHDSVAELSEIQSKVALSPSLKKRCPEENLKEKGKGREREKGEKKEKEKKEKWRDEKETEHGKDREREREKESGKGTEKEKERDRKDGDKKDEQSRDCSRREKGRDRTKTEKSSSDQSSPARTKSAGSSRSLRRQTTGGTKASAAKRSSTDEAKKSSLTPHSPASSKESSTTAGGRESSRRGTGSSRSSKSPSRSSKSPSRSSKSPSRSSTPSKRVSTERHRSPSSKAASTERHSTSSDSKAVSKSSSSHSRSPSRSSSSTRNGDSSSQRKSSSSSSTPSSSLSRSSSSVSRRGTSSSSTARVQSTGNVGAVDSSKGGTGKGDGATESERTSKSGDDSSRSERSSRGRYREKDEASREDTREKDQERKDEKERKVSRGASCVSPGSSITVKVSPQRRNSSAQSRTQKLPFSRTATRALSEDDTDDEQPLSEAEILKAQLLQHGRLRSAMLTHDSAEGDSLRQRMQGGGNSDSNSTETCVVTRKRSASQNSEAVERMREGRYSADSKLDPIDIPTRGVDTMSRVNSKGRRHSASTAPVNMSRIDFSAYEPIDMEENSDPNSPSEAADATPVRKLSVAEPERTEVGRPSSKSALLGQIITAVVNKSFSEDDVWQGTAEVLEVVQNFREDIVRLYGPGTETESCMVTIHFPNSPLFNGQQMKTYNIKTKWRCCEIMQLIQRKLQVKPDGTSYSLTTLAGEVLQGQEIVAAYGLGTLMPNWELKVVAADGVLPKAMIEQLQDLNMCILQVLLPPDGPFSISSSALPVSKMDTPADAVAALCKKLVVEDASQWVLVVDQFGRTVLLDQKREFSRYGMGEKFTRWELRLMDKKLAKSLESLPSCSSRFAWTQIEGAPVTTHQLRSIILQLDSTGRRLQRESRQAKNALQQATSHMEEVLAHNEFLVAQIADSNEKRFEMRKRVTRSVVAEQKAQDTLAKVRTQLKKARKECSKKDREIQLLREACDRRKAAADKLKGTVKQQKDDFSVIQGTVSKELTRYVTENKELQRKLAAALRERESRVAEITDLQRLLGARGDEALLNKHAETVALRRTMGDRIESVTNANAMLEIELEKERASKLRGEEEKKSLEERMIDMENRIKELEAELEEKVRKEKERKTLLKAEVEHLQLQVTKEKTASLQLSESLDEYRDRYQSSQREKELLHSKIVAESITSPRFVSPRTVIPAAPPAPAFTVESPQASPQTSPSGRNSLSASRLSRAKVGLKTAEPISRDTRDRSTSIASLLYSGIQSRFATIQRQEVAEDLELDEEWDD